MPSVINATTANGVTVQGDNSGSLQLATNNGTTAVTIDTSQKVGIGTTSPTGKIHVYGSGEVQTLQRSSGSANNYTLFKTESGADQAYLGFSDAGVNDFAIYNVQNGYIRFGTNNAERMRIDSFGSLLVNATSNGYGVTGGIYAPSVYGFTTASAANMFIESGGFMRRSTSSIKYKTDVQDATHGLADVLKIRPVTYKGINDGETVFGGLIAEEVHEAGLTEFVQYADDGSPDALAYGNMVSLLTKAIQELNAKVEAQAVRIAELEGAK